MTSDQLAEFKNKLEKEKDVLEESLTRLGTQNPANPSDWMPSKAADESFGADKNDNADIIEMEGENNASLNELEVRMMLVINALNKIEDGAYGVCDVGGEEIELDRLTANPAARTCKAHMDKESAMP